VVGDPMLKKFEPVHITSGNNLFKYCRSKSVRIVTINQTSLQTVAEVE
jgi:hypothetical protein